MAARPGSVRSEAQPPGPEASFPALPIHCCHSAAQAALWPRRAGLEGGSHVRSPGQEGTRASPLLLPPRAEILMVFALNVPSRWIQQGSWGQRQAHGLSLHAFIMARGSPYGPWQTETVQTVLWVESGQRPPLGNMTWPARGCLLERWLRQADHQPTYRETSDGQTPAQRA